MITPIVNTWIVLLMLTAINLTFLFLFKTHKKFYLGQILLFVLAFAFILSWDNFIFPHYKDKIEAERKADKQKNNQQLSDEVWLSTKQTEDFLYSLNRPIFETVIFQTTLTFLFSIIGLRRTVEKKLFRTTSTVFGILSVIGWFAYFIASIAPTRIV